MYTLLHAWARLKRLKWREIFCLTLLCIAVLCLSIVLSCLDIALTSQLLDTDNLLDFGINYLLAGLIWIPLAHTALTLKRRKGYGATCTTCCLALFWIFALYLADTWPSHSLHQVLFACKYGTFFLLNVTFWILAKRFLKLTMNSLKFLGIFCFELIGFMTGGLLALLFDDNLLFYIAVLGLLVCSLLFYSIGRMSPVHREVFIKKNCGIQNYKENALIPTILALSFCWTSTQLLIEFQIYHDIISRMANATMVLGQLYMGFAGTCLLALLCFAHTRFLYTTPLGLVICVIAIGCCALGQIFTDNHLMFGGAILFFVTSHFYVHRYLSLLPRPLKLGIGIYPTKLRWLLMMPCGFIFVGALLLTLPVHTIKWILLGAMFVLSLLFAISAHLYGRELMKMCALRIWRSGPLMIAYPPLKQMILQGISKRNSTEAIYFLNFLNEGYTSQYRTILTQTLYHPSKAVCLLALKRIRACGVLPKERQQIHSLMMHHPSKSVQNMALSVLISDALESNATTAWHKYKSYLDKKHWVSGACSGFLYGRAAWREKVIHKVVELANSRTEIDNLMALSVMSEHPQSEWVESVQRLLNSPFPEVVKQAIHTAGLLSSPLLLNRLLPLLDETEWRDDVLEALNQYDKIAFPAIEKTILNDAAPLIRRKELVLFLGRLPSGEGKQILLRALFNASRVLRGLILQSIMDSEIIWTHHSKRKILEQMILFTAQEWFHIREIFIQAENLEAPKLQNMKVLFQESIHEELYYTRSLLLEQISLYSLTPLAQNALHTLQGTDWNAFAAATGCLQDILPKKIYNKIRYVLLYPTWNEPPKNLETMPISVFLNNFLFHAYDWTSPWMKALALYGWRELADPAGLIAVKYGLKSKDWIVLEAALSALIKLEKNHSKVEELILNIPTRYLLKQNLENFLEEKHVHHH